MKFAQDIVLAPVITENSMAGIADKKYTSVVAIAARACTPATLPRARRPSSP